MYKWSLEWKSDLSSVQNPLTIPVNSLPPELPPCFRGLGFGFRGEMCDGWHFHGASTIHQGYVLCTSYHDFEYAQAFQRSFPEGTEYTYFRETFRGASATSVSASAKVL